ncbi:MAG: hypothetical protein ACRBFS_07995 [Aureispira sp.]
MPTDDQQPSNSASTNHSDTSNDAQQDPNKDLTANNSSSNSDSNSSPPKKVEGFNSMEELHAAYGAEDIQEEDDDIVDEWLSGGSSSDETPLEEEEEEEEEEDDEEDLEDYPWGEEEDNDQEEEVEEIDLEEEEQPTASSDTVSASDLLGRVSDAKNLERTGTHFFNEFDKFKARLCAKLDGELHATEFLASEEMKKILINNFKAVCKEMQIELPPAAWIFIGSLAMYSAPVVMLLLKKYGEQYLLPLFKKVTPTAAVVSNASSDTIPPTSTADQHPYAYTKEYRQKRRYFQRHSTTGAYKYTLDGKPIKVALADDMPHPDIAEELDALKGQKEINKTMRMLLDVE